MKRRQPRVTPSLEGEPAERGPAVFVPPRSHAPAPQQPPPTRRSWPGRLVQWLVWGALAALAALLVLILSLRWLPPPTTAFMLQSPVDPVRYRWVDDRWIADTLKRAVVASEDQKFFEHRGFDFEAIGDALEENREGGRRRGASTISQQTAKNLFLWSGGGYFRKGLEAALTVAIETLWSKDRILEVYLNIAEFGPGLYGAEAAAHAYFDKPAARLGAEEAARLAAVLPSPRRWSAREPGPYVRSRSAWILRQMGAAATGGGAVPEDAPPQPDAATEEPDLEPLRSIIEATPESGGVETRPLDDEAGTLDEPVEAYALPATETPAPSPEAGGDDVR